MEGPSIVILVEEAQKFVGSRVKQSRGSSTLIDVKALAGQRLLELKSWGKHFLLVFERTTLKVHFMMFGSYRIDDPKPGMKPRLSLRFKSGELYLYACSIREITGPLPALYDWRADVMAPEWSETLAVRKIEKLLGKHKRALICDAVLSQDIFGGAGNIIKNEVLFRMQLHPETMLGRLSRAELRLLAREVRLYSFQFYVWKKQYLLRKNWLIYRQKFCAVCESKVQQKSTGKFMRRSFFCPACQKLRRSARAQKAAAGTVRGKLANATAQLANLRKQMTKIVATGALEREH